MTAQAILKNQPGHAPAFQPKRLILEAVALLVDAELRRLKVFGILVTVTACKGSSHRREAKYIK